MNAINTNDVQGQIITQIQNLMKELQKCAPHPDRPEHKGALFIQADDSHKLTAEYDGMLGLMMFDSALGDAFGEAAGYGSEAMDMASKYLEDRSASSPRNTPFQLGQKRVIANDFNTIGARNAAYQAMLEAYMADLPTRINLEKWISHETRRLYALRKHAMMGFGLAA
jgi:hypothetical protein